MSTGCTKHIFFIQFVKTPNGPTSIDTNGQTPLFYAFVVFHYIYLFSTAKKEDKALGNNLGQKSH